MGRMKKTILFNNYLKKLLDVNVAGDAREESFYATLEEMVKQMAASSERDNIHITTLPKPTEAGNPDFRVWNGIDRIIGYIEAKRPGEEYLDQIEESEQLRRYRSTFPNLILTNFLEFRLYRNGELIDKVLLGRPIVLNRIHAAPPVENIENMWALLERFLDFSLPRTFTAESLAVELAKRTRFLRDVISHVLNEELETGQGELHGFYDAFRQFLIGDLSLDDFANLYAQTITYGLFAARSRVGDGFNRRTTYDRIPHTIGVLRDLFRFISLGDLPPQLEWIVDDIANVLAVADAPGILARYYHDGKGSDPIVHFYETFLAHYDPEERERRGVYYTPEPIVDYIVRSLHHLLKTRFSKTDGLASQDVTLLDPAAGTMTFVARAAQQAVHEFESKYGSGAREAFIRDSILRNFFAFELMMAPYAIGHLKMAFYLEELGHRLTDTERVRFYLTNTLDMIELDQSRLPGFSSLAEESHLAGQVKRRQPVLVILGNPPYSGQSANQGQWIRKKIEDYKQVDGIPLGEKNPKWLQNDYVKFLRFAEWKIAQSGSGVVGMITDNSYLENPTFRGMRRHLMQTYDEIYLLDLHGNSNKREKCPDGSSDENVFDIQQGVAIVFFVKNLREKQNQTNIYHSQIWGKREEKYGWLLEHDFSNTSWETIDPKKELYLFVPRNESALDQYNTFMKATDIFKIYSVGIVTARDNLTIHWTIQDVWDTVLNFSQLNSELARQAYNLGKDVQDWKVTLAQEDIKRNGPDREKITSIIYRPFDVRFTYYTGHSRGFHCRPRPEVMRHMVAGENMALITPRRVEHIGSWQHAFVTNKISDHVSVSLKTIDYHFPLYLYPDPTRRDLFSTIDFQSRIPNLNERFMTVLVQAYCEAPTPEALFHYIYAVLYAPSYREKYVQFLRSDFPRIPFPIDGELFSEMAKLGQRLVALHLLESDELNPPLIRFDGQGDNRIQMGKRDGLRYDTETQRLYINNGQYFAPIVPEIWEYTIGGYQVAEKWLKDRRGRCLSLDEVRAYCRILTALARTSEIQIQIDDLYLAVESKVLTISLA
jgi:hypothetical protein